MVLLGRCKKLMSVWCMLLFITTIHAQITVSGGEGTPKAFIENSSEKLQVYLVYGVENVELRFTSGSTSHQWYRYKTKANEKEPIASVQEGNTSIVRNVEEGYGYFVGEPSINTQFVWIIDYSKYVFDVQDIQVMESENQCVEIALQGNINAPVMFYCLPSDGSRKNLEREIEVTYTTMKDSPEDNRFILTDTIIKVIDNPFKAYYDPPLADTEFRITGDQFARHFNMEKTASSGLYQAVAVKARADTTLLSIDGSNVLSGQGESSFSAPAEFRFFGYGNTPVTSKIDWIIYNKEEGNINNSLVPRDIDDLTYTFTRKGTYIAHLMVYSRGGAVQCVDSTYSFEINIRESDLQIPNFFSPGTSPGYNDEFRVAYKSLVSFKGWIFNRWGVQMFHWTDPAKGWDGKKGGKFVPPGVYFYVIEAKGSDDIKYNRKGHINIIRPKNEDTEIIE